MLCVVATPWACSYFCFSSPFPPSPHPHQNVPNNISAVLYAYSPIPDGLFLYDAADLPATPFEALCDGTSCRLA